MSDRKRISDFKAFNDSQSENYLAAHTPKGKLFGSRFVAGSVMYRMLLCLSTVAKVVTGQLEVFARNMDVSQASELLQEREASVMIPERYARRDTIAGRREAAERKGSKIPVYNVQSRGSASLESTIEEYVRLMTGIEITIDFREASSSFPAPFPIVFDFTGGTENFFFVIQVPVTGQAANNQFELPFPVSFFDPAIPDATQELLDIILDDVVPSFCDWTYEAVVS